MAQVRLVAIRVQQVPPVALFEASELSDVVVLGGPNGVGKTRLVEGLIQAFQDAAATRNIRLVVEATTSEERADWGKPVVDTANVEDAKRLATTLRRTRFRSG